MLSLGGAAGDKLAFRFSTRVPAVPSGREGPGWR